MQDMQEQLGGLGAPETWKGCPAFMFICAVERHFILYSLFSGNVGDKMAHKRQEELKHCGREASDSSSGIGQSVHVFLLNSTIQRNPPECISNSVMKIDEIVMINHKEVSTVEIEVSFLKDIFEFFLFCLRLSSSIAVKWCKLCDFANQESDLT